MAQPWTASLDKAVSVEPPNAVAYVTYAHEDGRTIKARVPYAKEIDLLNFLALECERLSALDERNAQMAAVVESATVKPGPISLPDLSTLKAKRQAQIAYDTKVMSALGLKQFDEVIAVDPTIASDKAALDQMP